MKKTRIIGMAALMLALAGDNYGQSQTNASTPRVIIEIVGGFGHLTSMELKSDGAFRWHGWEPGRRVVSVRDGKLEADELRAIVDFAGRVRDKVSSSAFAGGEDSYTLVLRSPQGQDRGIKIERAIEDQRPDEIKQLLDLLWATRNRERKRSEP